MKKVTVQVGRKRQFIDEKWFTELKSTSVSLLHPKVGEVYLFESLEEKNKS